MADGLAKWAVAHPTEGLAVGLKVQDWINDGSLRHVWLLLAAWKCPEQWPQHVSDTLVDDGIHTSFDCQNSTSWCGIVGDAARPSSASSPVHFICASINVQTLNETGRTDESAFLGRSQYIRDQLAHVGVCIAGLQETRSMRDECLLSGSYIRLCSGRSPSGQYGVEAWFARRTGSTADATIAFLPEELTVVHWDPRLICVKVSHSRVRFMVVVLHAPTSHSPERAEWQQCRDIVERVANGLPVVILGDFNVRFTQPRHSRVGGHVWPDKTAVPLPLFELMERQDLWAPSTFEGCHSGPHETWFPPGGGSGSRIDYVMVPVAWTVPARGSYVLDGLDFGQVSIDHLGVCLHVSCRSTCAKGNLPSVPRLDQARMATPEGQAIVQRICKEAPLFPWGMDANSHFAALSAHVRQRLAEEFPAASRRRAQSFLTDATWVLRGQRVWLRRRTAWLRRRILRVDVGAAFRAWRVDRPLACMLAVVTAGVVGATKEAHAHVEALRDTKKECVPVCGRTGCSGCTSWPCRPATCRSKGLCSGSVLCWVRPETRPEGLRGFQQLPNKMARSHRIRKRFASGGLSISLLTKGAPDVAPRTWLLHAIPASAASAWMCPPCLRKSYPLDCAWRRLFGTVLWARQLALMAFPLS